MSSESISEFIKPKVEEPNDETAIVKADGSSTEIVVAPTPEEIKKQRYREQYQKYKQRLNELRANQIKGARVILFNITGSIRQIDVATEDDYKQVLTDLLGTLKDNELLTDFLITSR